MCVIPVPNAPNRIALSVCDFEEGRAIEPFNLLGVTIYFINLSIHNSISASVKFLREDCT